MAGIVVVVAVVEEEEEGVVVVEANGVELEDENFGEGVDYDDAAPCEKEQRIWRVAVVDSAAAVGHVAVVEGGVADGRLAVADAAAEDEFDPKDPVGEVRVAEDLEKGMGLNESAAKNAEDAADA